MNKHEAVADLIQYFNQSDVARLLGISRERVRQICASNGINPKHKHTSPALNIELLEGRPGAQRPRKQMYPFAEMKPGQYFELPFDENAQAARVRCAQVSTRPWAKERGVKFVSRRHGDTLRIYCIER